MKAYINEILEPLGTPLALARRVSLDYWIMKEASMRKKILRFLPFLLVVFLATPVFAYVKIADKMEIQKAMKAIEQAINKGDTHEIISILSPYAASTLKNEIMGSLGGQSISFQESITSYDEISANKVKVSGRFEAKGVGWHATGFANYFTFHKVDGRWLLLDTDFHRKLNPAFVGKFVLNIFAILIPLFIIFTLFWLWMLIDCITKPVENKIVWILVIIFLGAVGAAVYFFVERKKHRGGAVNQGSAAT